MVHLPRRLLLAATLGLLLAAYAAAGRATTSTPPTPIAIANAPIAGGDGGPSTAAYSASLAAIPAGTDTQRGDPSTTPAGPAAATRPTLTPLPLPVGTAPVQPLGDADLAGTVFLLPVGTGGYAAVVIMHGVRLPVIWLLARGTCANPGTLPASASGEVLPRRSSTAGKARLEIEAAWLAGPLVLLAENSADDQRLACADLPVEAARAWQPASGIAPAVVAIRPGPWWHIYGQARAWATPSGDLLLPVAERHQQHEEMRFVELAVNPAGSFASAAAINFRLARRADDLPERIVAGKGGVNCAQGTIFLWAQGS